MAKQVYAKLMRIDRKRISLIGRGPLQYDDNVIGLRVRISDGPEAMVDRSVHADISIEDFVKFCPREVLAGLVSRIQDELASDNQSDACS